MTSSNAYTPSSFWRREGQSRCPAGCIPANPGSQPIHAVFMEQGLSSYSSFDGAGLGHFSRRADFPPARAVALVSGEGAVFGSERAYPFAKLGEGPNFQYAVIAAHPEKSRFGKGAV